MKEDSKGEDIVLVVIVLLRLIVLGSAVGHGDSWLVI